MLLGLFSIAVPDMMLVDVNVLATLVLPREASCSPRIDRHVPQLLRSFSYNFTRMVIDTETIDSPD